MAANKHLNRMLVFKGARVLALRMGVLRRQSLDIDCNLREEVLEEGTREELRARLEGLIEKALAEYFERQEVVRFKLEAVRVKAHPKQHLHGWDAFKVKLNVSDSAQRSVRNLPKLEIDIAYPEELTENSMADLETEGGRVTAYTIERQVAEKLRAFLTSLPQYRTKIRRDGGGDNRPEPIRVKDIFDIACVERDHPIGDQVDFWGIVLSEFTIACKSRYVDCAGLESFEQDIGRTTKSYRNDPTYEAEVPFEEAWDVIQRVCKYMEKHEILPLSFEVPIPEKPECGDG